MMYRFANQILGAALLGMACLTMSQTAVADEVMVPALNPAASKAPAESDSSCHNRYSIGYGLMANAFLAYLINRHNNGATPAEPQSTAAGLEKRPIAARD